MNQRVAFSAFFWLAVAAMAAAYVTTPAFKFLYQRFTIPWYRGAAAIVVQRPGAAALAARHARQAILTRQTLPAGAAAHNADWFARWDENYLNYHRGELDKMLASKGPAGAPLHIDVSSLLRSDGVRLIETRDAGDDGRAHRIEITDNARVTIRLDRLISPLEFRRLVFEIAPVGAPHSPPAAIDNYCQVHWFAEGVTPPYRDEQSAIIPLSGDPGDPAVEGLSLDLSGRYDWLACHRVRQFILHFRLAQPMEFEITTP